VGLRQGVKNSEEKRLELAAQVGVRHGRSPVLDNRARPPARPQQSPGHPGKRGPDGRDPAPDPSRAKRASVLPS
jgi:hypothetical protein